MSVLQIPPDMFGKYNQLLRSYREYERQDIAAETMLSRQQSWTRQVERFVRSSARGDGRRRLVGADAIGIAQLGVLQRTNELLEGLLDVARFRVSSPVVLWHFAIDSPADRAPG